MFDIVILSDKRYINPKERNWYINQVLLEDDLLKNQLEIKGLKVTKKSWDDKNFDWRKTRFAIFRTTWDYFDRFDEFFKWIEETKNKTNFINSSEIINWNIDKHYLLELQKKGINIAHTKFIEKNNDITLSQLFDETNWEEAVLKPTISGAARHTYRLNKKNYTLKEKLFEELLNHESMMFQEFLNDIIKSGEISLVMIGGKYTHAVRKIAKNGDFRVQDDHGGTVERHQATNKEIIFAENCIKQCPFNPIYARVDIVYDNNNNPSLSELELIEPELWFRNNNDSVKKLVDEILKLL